ncbi:hypothetical protein LTR10_018104 [Elasticomyces elasticus]|uniref:3beta-hydroxysteroid 3-dehydrogenase n=1 Tax=Exophiala sideris TaxID=1016849 RepID=A0ABR0IWM3_9EURO|nr:hypothetical protein LTR10_018104 [Elasticomyces elasticus]KAK5021701.1 hypothetical protein LTS07_010743 [Exophiala sideris]KAK5025144.1 hypothetical protein LTR13_010581 [Exophiala sideris]KAK5050132.1 hypothetical protein LTR69_010766 [Exophiala sideris]KAK5176880.1 hypothetical protein LTR44_010576 [Eurotiomycetes sp. CCFEE 6388]
MAGTVLITGANGTLALEFVEALLTLHPQYTLVATVRNASPEVDPNTATLMQISKKHPNAKVEVEELDLGRLADVRRFAERVSKQIDLGELPRIAAVVCNASTWSLEAGQKFTSDGLEATFQVTHLSHYLLVLKLLGCMDMSSGRIVMLGSITHYPEKPNPLSAFRPEFPADIEHLVRPLPDRTGEVHDRGYQRYGTAKLSNVTFMYDLNNRLEADPSLSKVTVTAMDPGGLATSRAQKEQKKSVQWMMAFINLCMPVLKHFTKAFRPTSDSARDLVAVSVEPEFQGKRGYYVGRKPDVSAEISKDTAVQKRLWAACWKWAGLTTEDTVLQNAAA